MFDAGSDVEDAAAARTRRKQRLLLVLLGLPMIVAATVAAHILRKQFHVERNLALNGALLLAMILIFLISRLVIGRRAIARLHAIPRLRSSTTESLDRSMRWARPVWIGGLLAALALFMLPMILSPRAGADTTSPWVLFSIVVWGAMYEPASLVPWLARDFEDELGRAQRLDAAQNGYAVVMFFGVLVVVLEGYRPGSASSLLPIVLILGMLAAQISLMLAERRARAGDD